MALKETKDTDVRVPNVSFVALSSGRLRCLNERAAKHAGWSSAWVDHGRVFRKARFWRGLWRPPQQVAGSDNDDVSSGMPLTRHQKKLLQNAYRDLLNYEGAESTAPIDPMSYRTSDGDHLIHIAALRGDLETVEVLLAAGEDVNAVGDMGNTPAHYAAMGKCRELFDLLLQRGADSNLENEFGISAACAWEA